MTRKAQVATADHHRSGLLSDLLAVAVPVAMVQLADLPDDARRAQAALWAAESVEIIAHLGGPSVLTVQPAVKATARYVAEPGTAATFAVIARGLAAMAQSPGGVTWLGSHWCTDHEVCARGARRAAELAGGAR
jgi:hypothetical protein